jgi:hypothetical protein
VARRMNKADRAVVYLKVMAAPFWKVKKTLPIWAKPARRTDCAVPYAGITQIRFTGRRHPVALSAWLIQAPRCVTHHPFIVTAPFSRV